MINHIRTGVILGAAVLVTAIGSALAAPITYTISAQFDSGITAFGTYDFDADLFDILLRNGDEAFSNVNVTTSNGLVFNTVNPSSAGNETFIFFAQSSTAADGDRLFAADLDGVMTSAGGTFSIVAPGYSFLGTRAPSLTNVFRDSNIVSGIVSSDPAAVPIPAAAPLFVGGLLVLMRRCLKF
ncbi:MAG: hypothetical protein AAFX52_04250 [Pseudomonadota bacterium]